MARKTKEDAQKTRDAILDAAESVFYTKGFTLTTMADIADSAGLSRGAVYGHYHGKLEVAIAMSARAIHSVLPFQPNARRSALENLKQYCLGEVLSYIEPSSIQRVLFFLYVKIDDVPELLQLRYQWEANRVQQINLLLQQAQAQGELAAGSDFDLISQFCQATIEGVFSIVYFGNLPPDERWKIAERLCEYALQRLATP